MLEKLFVVALFSLGLGGCVIASQPEAMTVHSDDLAPAGDKLMFGEAIAVSSVTGGTETNPLLISEISDGDFKTALIASLKNTGYLSQGKPAHYQMAATIVNIVRPQFGFVATVTTTIRYVITDQITKSIVFDETIEAACTKRVSDTFFGVVRLRYANEGSARENIEQMILRLRMLNLQGSLST